MEGLFLPTALKGKVSVITGAGRGLGRVMALSLAKAGSDIVLTARTLEQIEGVAREVSDLGGKALAIRADVTKSEDISHMVEKVTSDFGGIDVLVNNAGQNASHVVHKFEDIPYFEIRKPPIYYFVGKDV